jgi:hypothetical protein
MSLVLQRASSHLLVNHNDQYEELSRLPEGVEFDLQHDHPMQMVNEALATCAERLEAISARQIYRTSVIPLNFGASPLLSSVDLLSRMRD